MNSQQFSRPSVQNEIARRFAIVESAYHHHYVHPMAEAAAAEIVALEPLASIERVVSPGSFEIPVLVRALLDRGACDAILALGLIWRGQTAHADLIARAVTDGLMALSLQFGCPIIHEVLVVENEEQAIARCLPGTNNRGVEAAHAAIQAARTLTVLRAGEPQ